MLQVASVMTVWNHIQPDYAANMWNEALNKRLGTQVVLNVLPFVFSICLLYIKESYVLFIYLLIFCRILVFLKFL